MYMNEVEAVSNQLKVHIKNLSFEIMGMEIVYNNACVSYVDKGFKEIKISAKRFYILDEKENDLREIIVAPMKSKNILTEDDVYKRQKKSIKSEMEIFMKPNGDKSIVWNIKKIKMMVKPYKFNSLLSFFMDSMPDYDHSADKPNGYYNPDGTIASKDPKSKMTFIIDIQESIFLLHNGIDKENMVMLDGHLHFNFHRENYIECKELLVKQYNKEYNKSKAMNSFKSVINFEPEGEIQMPVGNITLNLIDPVFKQNKRNFTTPCNIFYSSKSMLEMKGFEKFILNTEQNINIGKTFLKFSLIDMMLFNSIIGYITTEITKYNKDREELLSPKEMVASINKDLDFERRGKTTFIRYIKEDSKEEMKNSQNLSQASIKNEKFRKVSEAYPTNTNGFSIKNPRKVTQDHSMIRQTGKFANADSQIYQSYADPEIINDDSEATEAINKIEKGNDSLDLLLSGLRIVLMNEYGTTYYPVMDINISEVHFEKHVNTNSSNGQTATYLSCFYYNPHLGDWEPFIENFTLFISMDSFNNKSCMTVSTDRIVNINLSDIVLQNLIDTFKSWSVLKENEENKEKDEFFAHIDKYQNQQFNKYSFDDIGMVQNYRNSIARDAKNYESDGDDLAAPISIINLTGILLTIQRIDYYEEESKVVVEENFREPEKVYQPIRVEFEEGLEPIENIDLSKLHANWHRLGNAENEIVYYGVHLNRMQKVLTVRTPFTIHNQTIFTYVLRVYNRDMEEFFIEPDQKLPIVKSMEGIKCSMCIANSSEDWSESFDPIEILEVLNENKEKTFLAHGLTYTFMSKSRDKDVNICYNLNLLCPIVLKNCLPFNIDVFVPGQKQTNYILKGEEAYFLSHDLIEPFEMQLKMDGFMYSKVNIDPQTRDTEYKVKIKDLDGLNLTLFIRIQRERAGLELILYSKVSIINFTGLKFDFFTSTKTFRKRVPGQKVVDRNIFMASKASKMILNFNGSNSKKLKTRQIGYKDDFRIKFRDPDTNIASIYEFVYTTSLTSVDNSKENLDLFSKTVKFFPKYVIVNHLDT